MNVLKSRLGRTATLTHVADNSSETITAIFNEYVGYVDNIQRAIWTFDQDDVSTEVLRGDFFVLDGETAEWHVVDVRNDKAGGVEVRADSMLPRL